MGFDIGIGQWSPFGDFGIGLDLPDFGITEAFGQIANLSTIIIIGILVVVAIFIFMWLKK